jgi:hypothetical protein
MNSLIRTAPALGSISDTKVSITTKGDVRVLIGKVQGIRQAQTGS